MIDILTFDLSANCFLSNFAKLCSARFNNSEICGVTSSAKSFCASFTSDSVINSKCYRLIDILKEVITRFTVRSFCIRGKSFIPVSRVARLFPN